jgi:hypothetical protein
MRPDAPCRAQGSKETAQKRAVCLLTPGYALLHPGLMITPPLRG